MRNLCLVLGIIGVVGTAVPIIRHQAWWIRIFDFPRLQLAGVCLLSVALYGLLSFRETGGPFDHFLAAAAALCFIHQARQIFPYTPFASRQVQNAGSPLSPASLRLLVSNVLMTNRRTDRFRQIVKDSDPDVILVAEPDEWWEQQLKPLESRYPFTVKHPLNNSYGMLLYSRLQLEDPQVMFLVEKDVPSMRMGVRLPSNDWVKLYFVHPKPPFPAESADSEGRDAELLLVAREVQKESGPAVIAGDLNDVAWSHTTRLFQRVSRMLDPRIGRGMYNTFHALVPFIRFPLDHVFHSDHFQLIRLERKGRMGSDHFPIFVHLAYHPRAAETQEAPPLKPEDIPESEEKINTVR
jgi:endonuclease/exonuclease/phosphatase (EEP) superfamily protein YafD